MILIMPVYTFTQIPNLLDFFDGQNLIDEKYKYEIKSYMIILSLFVTLQTTGLIWQLVKTLPHDDIILWIAFVVLILLFIPGVLSIQVLPYSCILILKSDLLIQLNKQEMVREDILQTGSLVDKAVRAFRLDLLASFSFVQIFIIFCIYVTISTPNNFNCILYVIGR